MAAPLVWCVGVGAIRIAVARALACPFADLTAAERAWLTTSGLGRWRRQAWARGRALARRWLGVRGSILVDERGAPRTTAGGFGAAHDGAWTAAIVAPAGPAVIDVVDDHAGGAARALRRVRWRGDVGPATTWAALECALKRTGAHVATLLDRDVTVVRARGGVCVEGVGSRCAVGLARLGAVTVAWSTGATP